MQGNRTKKRLLSLLLCGVMLFALVPVGIAFAADASPVIIPDNGTYSFTGDMGPITVEENCTPTITLNNVTITSDDAPAIWIKAGATVNIVLEGQNTLTGGPGHAGIFVNPAYTDNQYDPNASAKLIVSGDGSLTATGGDGDPNGMFGGGAGIGGDGQNFVADCVDCGVIVFSDSFTGTIHAFGGEAYRVEEVDWPAGSKDYCSFGGGAGIGSGGFDCYDKYDWYEVCGRIEIHNGTIIANEGMEAATVGAGIGSGTGGLAHAQYTDYSDIEIQITGGNIMAQGGGLSAGIGGGSMCDGGNVSISGGTVVAKAGAAESSMGASGIGGGNDGGVLYRIDITGGEVTAVASGGAAGIGGASNTSFSNLQYGDTNGDRTEGKIGIINISGKNTIVNAYGGSGTGSSGLTYGGAGIGSGYPTVGTKDRIRSVAFDISITDGATVNAYGGYHAQAIGYGYNPNGQDDVGLETYIGYGIELTLDDTITLWAQNADCYQRALVSATRFDKHAPIKYQSADKYLLTYEDPGKNTIMPNPIEAAGYLKWQENQLPAKEFAWEYANGELLIENRKYGNVEDDLKGNWAILSISEPKYGNLQITNVVHSDKAPAEDIAYEFKIWMRDENGAAAAETVSYSIVKQGTVTANGNVTIGADGCIFSLKNGESLLLGQITEGRRVEVRQLTTGNFTTTTSGLTDGVCVISANSTSEIRFLNDYGNASVPDVPQVDVPKTGDSSNVSLWLVLACASLCGMTAAALDPKYAYKRRK